MKDKILSILPQIGIALIILWMGSFFIFNPVKWPEAMTNEEIIKTTELCRQHNMKTYWNNAGNRVSCGPTNEDFSP